jgi:hypothetical protein
MTTSDFHGLLTKVNCGNITNGNVLASILPPGETQRMGREVFARLEILSILFTPEGSSVVSAPSEKIGIP